MKRIIFLGMIFLLISKFGYCQSSDTLITWSLVNDTSPTYVVPELKAKGERVGAKLPNVSYSNGYQKISPPSGGWQATIDTTINAGVYLDFPFKLDPSPGFNFGQTFTPYNIIVNGYTDAANDSIKLSAYLYDSSLYYDSASYFKLLNWDTTQIYSGTIYNGNTYYYKYINGHWYYFFQNSINPGIYDSSIFVYTNPYNIKATIQKTGDYYIKSNSSLNPDSINSSSSFQAWLNLPKKIFLMNDRVVFARIYISSNNPNANLYLKNFVIGGYIISLLPITFNSFTATKNSNNVQLNWSMKDETNIDKYVVEKAVSKDLYKPIKAISGNGKTDYSCIDENPVIGENLYRIKAVSKDGKASYSNALSVLFGGKNDVLFISPNPVKDVLNVQIKSNKQEKVLMQVVDFEGKIVQQKQQQLQVGSNVFAINATSLSKGIYSLVVLGTKSQSIQFVKE